MSPAKYLGAVALTLSSLCALHWGAFVYQLGAELPAEYWLYECRIVKEWLIKARPSPKLVVAGGSNALFGIDSALLEESVGIPTFNLSLHGSLFLWQTLLDAQAHLAPGDYVLLSPGYTTFFARPAYDSWLTDQVMTWDTEYFWQRDAVEKVRFIGSVPFPRLLAGGLFQAFGRALPEVKRRRLRSPDEIIEEYGRHSVDRTTEGVPVYSHLNLSARGDVVQATGKWGGRWDYGLGNSFQENKNTWNTLRSFRDHCRAHDVRVYFAWPPTVRHRALKLQSEPVRAHLLEIRRRIEELAIPILGEPQEFQYHRSLFADSPYHLNARGRELRTRQIAGYLKEQLSSRATGPAPR